METIKKMIQAEPENVVRANFLELAKKDTRGLPQSNGVHHVKLLRGEEGESKDFKTQKMVKGVWLYFEEDGMEKKYFVPTYYNDKNSEKYGKFYYLFEKFADIAEGSLLEIEYVKKGVTGYIDVRPEGSAPVQDMNDIPVIEDEQDMSEYSL